MNILISNWKASLTFFLLLLLVLSLGVWQIDRGYNKKELENTFLERQSQPVKEIKYNTFLESDLYRQRCFRRKIFRKYIFFRQQNS